MNFLAHLYLSGNNPDVQLGNFMADAVKGRNLDYFSPGVKTGIVLHRFIDDFTDTHPIVTQTKVLFRPTFSKLAPILVDIVYDHYLAKNWQSYHPDSLRSYVDGMYAMLNDRKEEMPERTRIMLPYMIQYDWLYNYQFKEGMEKVLLGMSRRVPNGDVLKLGWDALEKYYDEVEEHFAAFFVELQRESGQVLLREQRSW